jgi:hypothetical protein
MVTTRNGTDTSKSEFNKLLRFLERRAKIDDSYVLSTWLKEVRENFDFLLQHKDIFDSTLTPEQRSVAHFQLCLAENFFDVTTYVRELFHRQQL